jgi:alpha-L-rhamnosidase
MRRFPLVSFFAAVCWAMLAGCASPALTPARLRCEYRNDPLTIDSSTPRLSWILASPRQDDRQTAFQILVASDPQLLDQDRADLWDSGKIASDNSIQIPYAGKPLTSRQTCYWKVRVWDMDSKACPWSPTRQWTMGLLTPQDWQAHWIGRGDEPNAADLQNAKWIWPKPQPAATKTSPSAIAVFRKTFEIPQNSRPGHLWLVLAAKAPATAFLDGQQVAVVDDPPNAQTFDLGLAAPGHHVLSITATSAKSHSGILGAIVQNSGAASTQVIPTDESWDATSDPNASPESSWAPARKLADYSDESWGAPGVQSPSLPLLRKLFTITTPPRRAIIYLCGLGQFELHINGQVVGNDVLQPGWTDYRKTCLYVAYDVTSLLKPGPNAIGVMLGNGMYNVTAGRYTNFLASMGSPTLIAQLVLDLPGGATQRITTDATWKTSAGPITFSSVYGGEDDDARLQPPHWDQPDFDDSAWTNAIPMPGPGGRLAASSRSAWPIQVAQILEPQRITQLPNGDFVYDLGQNCSIIPAITASGPAGAVVRLTPGELLNPDGSVDQKSFVRTKLGAWYSYTLNGQGQEQWSPRFTYIGCRYIQVHGAAPAGSVQNPNQVTLLRLEGRFITSTQPTTGDFSCSNDLFNRTAALIEWAIRSNSQSILTDCPQREHLGWLEQDQLMGPSLLYSHDTGPLMNKIAGDMRDAQHADGLVPDIAPEYSVMQDGYVDSPEWGSSCVLVPWSLYEWYGDSRVLAESYDMMTRYVDHLASRSNNNIVSYGLGDWFDLGPGPLGKSQLTPIALTATAFYYRDLHVLSQAAAVLGRPDDAAKLAARARAVAESFNKTFYHPARHSYATDSQAANAIPVVFGLAPQSDVPAIVANIVADMQKRGDALTAGDVGYRFVLQALADHGQSEEIFKVNNQSARPGYGYQLAHGSTSLPEAWDADPRDSQDHFMLGHILEWFYRDLAGIQPDPAAPGFSHVVIKPQIVGDITSARARYDSIRGPITTQWQRTGKQFQLDVTIPPSVTATVFVPAKSKHSVDYDDAKFQRMDGPYAVFEIGSGTYHFAD